MNRLGIVSYLLGGALWLFVPLALYRLLKGVDQTLAAILVFVEDADARGFRTRKLHEIEMTGRNGSRRIRQRPRTAAERSS